MHLKIDQLVRMNKDVLAEMVLQKQAELEKLQSRMIDKKEVAKLVGMTVSWLNSSPSQKAKKLRACAIKYNPGFYGTVMFPLVDVVRIRDENETEDSEHVKH